MRVVYLDWCKEQPMSVIGKECVVDCKNCKHYSAQERVRFGFCDYPVPIAYGIDKHSGIVGVSDGRMYASRCRFFEPKELV